MPAGDGTGPMGMGPMTGRGTGFCSGFGAPGYANPVPGRSFGWGRGFGFGRGRGFGRGFGWGRGFGRRFGWGGPYTAPYGVAYGPYRYGAPATYPPPYGYSYPW
jgi:hypothetical protein